MLLLSFEIYITSEIRKNNQGSKKMNEVLKNINPKSMGNFTPKCAFFHLIDLDSCYDTAKCLSRPCTK